MSDLFQERDTLINISCNIALHELRLLFVDSAIAFKRACSGTRGDVHMVRSCPLLQDTVRTKSTDTRCHGPKIIPSAIWKMKMHGRIQLTSFQLSVQQVCSLSLWWSLTGSKEIQVIYPIQTQMLSSWCPQPWLLAFTQVSIPVLSQHHCCMQCKLHLWDQVQKCSSPTHSCCLC